jgi:DNA-binding GntR family transcriptional regulator
MGRTDSMVEEVYGQILHWLRERGVTSQEIVSDVSLAEELGVSRTPVRTALTMLECEGLLRRVRGKGWSTMPLSIRDIEEIFDLKEILEAYAASQAAHNLTPASAEALQNAMREMEEAIDRDDQDAEVAADLHFHELLLQIADNARLTEIDKRLDSQWYPLRKGSVMLQGGMTQSCQEHRLLVEAVLARDADRAAEMARAHHHRVRQDLINIMRNVLKPFLGNQGTIE